ncbi:hypothetical protein GCM10018785_70780 [Streptomyces longispororuber]|uniref:Uncharacterized protein n=1 Tax=Streptomyces longispororuber TaxID=68230 RepID=A0A919ACP4_9ACTN|nr:hypothetical protein GCM10018785_70780 [Streptomyces longispororuber]
MADVAASASRISSARCDGESFWGRDPLSTRLAAGAGPAEADVAWTVTPSSAAAAVTAPMAVARVRVERLRGVGDVLNTDSFCATAGCAA